MVHNLGLWYYCANGVLYTVANGTLPDHKLIYSPLKSKVSILWFPGGICFGFENFADED